MLGLGIVSASGIYKNRGFKEQRDSGYIIDWAKFRTVLKRTGYSGNRDLSLKQGADESQMFFLSLLSVKFARKEWISYSQTIEEQIELLLPNCIYYTFMVDVKELINKYTVEELCQESESYFKRMPSWDIPLAKPFASVNESQHLLINFSHLIHGLQISPGMTVLDFGCGTAWTSRFLNQLGCSVISLDVSGTALEIGEKLKESHKVFGKQPEHKFLMFNGRNINLPDDSVDRIFCLDAFHHVPNQSVVLHEMSRILKHGGIAGFSEPGPNHSQNPQSQFEMINFRVIENDIILDEIFQKAKKAGFTDIRVSISSTYPFIVPLHEFQHFLENDELITDYLNRTNWRMNNYPIFFLYKGRSEINDSRNGEGLIAEVIVKPQSLSVKKSEQFTIEADITNISTKLWLPSGGEKGCVNVGAFLFSLNNDGSMINSKELRFSLSAITIKPGEKITMNIPMDGLEPGQYRLEIDLVSEFICWFQFNGSKKSIVTINVEKAM